MGMNMETTRRAEHRRTAPLPGAGSSRERTPTTTAEDGLNEYISVPASAVSHQGNACL